MSTTIGNGVVDQGLLGARWLLLEVMVFSGTSRSVCSLSMSTTSGGVTDVSHVAMFSYFDGTYVSDNLRLGSSAGYRSLNHQFMI